MTHKILVNGRPTDAGLPVIGAMDRGFTLGDGVFETFRAYGGRPFLLGQHFDRLERGARALEIPCPLDAAELATQVEETLRLNGLEEADACIRVTLSRGPGERGLRPPFDLHPTVVVRSVPMAPPLPPDRRTGRAAVISATVFRNERNCTSRHKTVSQVDNVLAALEAGKRDADEALLLNTAGELTEGATTNLFWVSRSRLQTPCVDCGLLPGITRSVVIDLALGLSIPVEEGKNPPSRLSEADEAFLTSSVREIDPLIRLEGLAIGSGVTGPVTMALMEALRSRISDQRVDSVSNR